VATWFLENSSVLLRADPAVQFGSKISGRPSRARKEAFEGTGHRRSRPESGKRSSSESPSGLRETGERLCLRSVDGIPGDCHLLSLSLVSLIACRCGFWRHGVPFHRIKPVRRTRAANHGFAVSSSIAKEGERGKRKGFIGLFRLSPQISDLWKSRRELPAKKRRGGSGRSSAVLLVRREPAVSDASVPSPRKSSGRPSRGRRPFEEPPTSGGKTYLTPRRGKQEDRPVATRDSEIGRQPRPLRTGGQCQPVHGHRPSACARLFHKSSGHAGPP